MKLVTKNMKRTLLILIAMLTLGMTEAKAAENDVLVSTDNTTMLLFAKKGEPLKFVYYGARINEQQASDIWLAGDAS